MCPLKRVKSSFPSTGHPLHPRAPPAAGMYSGDFNRGVAAWLDGGYAAPEIFAFLEREGLEDVVAMGENRVREPRPARLMGTARRLSRETGETAHLYSECRYAAGTWPKRLLPGSRSYEMRARILRSEERRVGKEGRSRWSPYH